jgi:hypothetical protein
MMHEILRVYLDRIYDDLDKENLINIIKDEFSKNHQIYLLKEELFSLFYSSITNKEKKY